MNPFPRAARLVFGGLLLGALCLGLGRAAWAAEGSPSPDEANPADAPKKEKVHKEPPLDPAKLAAQAKAILRSRCFECHGGSKTAEGVKILDHELLIAKKKLVPNKPDDSLLFQLITSSDEPMMPPPEQPRLSAEDIATIRQWISVGAPAFPEDIAKVEEAHKDPALKDLVGVDYVLKRILEHVRSLPVDERPYMRYFSTNHLLTAGATRDELDLQRDALAKSINHLSWERQIVELKPIDKLETVFVIDLRKLGWHKQPFSRMADGKVVGRSKLNLFDLALLEYPYGVIYEDSETFDHLTEEFLEPANMARPIPFIRADWFCSAATLPPLYEDFLQMPFEVSDLATLLGVDIEGDRTSLVAKRAGMTVSGVSHNNRVVERHPAKYGSMWISFDYNGNKGQANMFKDPIDLHPAGGEMIFTLPNGLQGYFVTNRAGRRLEVAPTNIVTDRFAEDKAVRNGLSCMRCHDQGMKGFVDNIRGAMERLPGSAGFDKRQVLSMYPKQAEMDAFLKEDSDRFLAAMKQALGKTSTVEPLYPVTHRFLDAPLQLSAVAAELGLADSAGLQQLFRTPRFTSLGLVPLTSGGVIRRDTWEDYYDQVVRSLGLGVPVVPLDGITRTEFPSTTAPFEVELTTSKKNNIFSPGDEFAIFVENKSKHELHIELIGTSAKGEQVIVVPATTIVKPGDKFRFPEKGSLKVQGGLGKEQVTLFASQADFPAGELLRGKGLTDRVVHAFYPLRRRGAANQETFDPSQLIKKTIEIETK
ncbi:MAG TPA: c-type cytochrome domain-containing protein [Pirellulales bacterium]|jgi:serine/threonine-protein kinase|nr:c-type cytochrome domain-containing protein [Pirellulales bacterium]